MKLNYLEKVNQCITFIEEHLKDKITIEEVLENTYYSYPQFYRIFLSIVGESITNYIRKRKLSCAAVELLETENSILTIALEYNFSSQQTFNRAFTGYFNLSPLKYKERGSKTGLYPPFTMMNTKKDIIPITVTIERLEPMTMASYHAYSNNIVLSHYEEQQEKLISKAWNFLISWQMKYEYHKKYGNTQKLPSTSQLGHFMIENQLHTAPHTRYFGFNHPYPAKDTEFGYEAWAMLNQQETCNEDEMNHAGVTMIEFQGGLYATAMASYGTESNLNQVWKSLHYWMAEHPEYQYGEHQWLEEHLTIASKGGFHALKLYLPIQEL